MSVGLAINTAGLLFHFRAIDHAVVLPVFDGLILGIIAAWHIRFAGNYTVRFFPSADAFPHKWRLLGLLLLPLLTAAGAFRLNNHAGNGLAIIALAIICGYALISALRSRNRNPWWYVAHLTSIAFALTLSVSLRSNHLLGFDINQEYQVFNAVLQHGIWQPHYLDGAYNACLSITILPAVLNTLIPIPSEYLFKVIMQLCMAIIPLIAFVIAARRFGNKRHYAYITALFFIAQTQFIFQFPGLLRQQVALLFFGLIFMAITARHYSNRQKNALALVFGLAMVLAHYSTTYIGIVLLGLLVCFRPAARAVLARVARRRIAQPLQQQPQSHMYFSALLVPILLLVTFLWYGQLLQATGGIVQKVSASLTNVHEAFAEDSRSDFLVQALDLHSAAQDPAKLQTVYKDQSKTYAYQPTADEYTPEVRASNGPIITNQASSVLYTISHKGLPLIVNILLIAGIIITIGLFLTRGTSLDEAMLGVACGIICALILVLPGLSQAYNIDRLYQQLLLLIGPALVYALAIITKRLPRLAVAIPVVVVMLCMCTSSGLSDQLAFKFSNVNLTNDGAVYDHYYVTDGEVASLQWAQRTIGTANIHLDRYAMLPATAYTAISAKQLRQGVLPTEIGKGDYVYASSVNDNKGLAFGYYQNHVFTFNFPAEYLSNHKNIIYTTGESRIYR
jgi:uncharacterized membrane protein